MKKRNIIMTISLAIGIILGIYMSASAAGFTPKASLYYVQAYDNVKFHTYTTPIKFGASVSVVIETPNSLILQDVLTNKPNNMGLKALIASLNKPLKRIYISSMIMTTIGSGLRTSQACRSTPTLQPSPP